MKIGRDPFVLISSFQGSVVEIGSTCRGAIAKGADPVVIYTMYLRQVLEIAGRYDFKFHTDDPIVTALAMFTPGNVGGWGVTAYTDFMVKERTDPFRPVNFIIQRMARFLKQAGSKGLDELQRYISAIYFRKFRSLNVWGFLATPLAVSVAGVSDREGPLRRAVSRKLRNSKICAELRAALELDSNSDVKDLVWLILRSCIWDVSILEILGGVRTLAPQMSMLKKLIDSDTVRAVLPAKSLSRLRRRAYIDSSKVVREFARAASRAVPGMLTLNLAKALQTGAPSLATRDIMDRWFDFLGVDVRNACLPDPLEIVIQPINKSEAVVKATVKEIALSGQDACQGNTAWSSPGSKYSDWYDGCPKGGRVVAKRSKGVLDISDANYKAYPSYAKNNVMFAAACSFIIAKGKDGATLYNIGRAMNGLSSSGFISCPIARIDPGVSV